ncbi:unnamed protein product [Amoebophrya sp. A25]|nr:unnamed protein product [Amoebophrya sp. A25]|eukprot:GSA25T00021250001.1
MPSGRRSASAPRRMGSWTTSKSTRSFFYPASLRKEKDQILASLLGGPGSSTGRDSSSTARVSSSSSYEDRYSSRISATDWRSSLTSSTSTARTSSSSPLEGSNPLASSLEAGGLPTASS